MEVYERIKDIKEKVDALRKEGKTIGLVSTMGYLHEGHLRLFDEAKKKADIVIVAVFVNPKQFGPNETLAKYPKDLEGDKKKCEARGIDILFAPSVEEIYPKGFSTSVAEDELSKDLCGKSRPYYFKGVTTLIAVYLNAIKPDGLCLGQRDAQLTAVVTKMIKDLQFDVKLCEIPIVRDEHGVVYSSSYFLMTDAQRNDARKVYEALEAGKKMADQGMRNVDRIIAEATHKLRQSLRLRVIYVSVVDKVTMKPLREVVPGQTLLMTAVWLDEYRLIDNIIL
ncbi:MAG: pantoate--beta-alanine ligase [Verrucomicrobia bacterium CG_4_10_14_3_um_filter_43_23]|nr:MAG: pantoate--beta-alanine ligase [Verrucomicrobia bacterium CG1_02_43_26]PIP58775.1 MAG: pantoate--beta-alanine ligase [Verrucomicrobia bacterium CG22_combo_CG10-13_8_21_14_all_43_17]PIX57622.1 MAG: pantoate--beta-alanine ligase [Verrucomicrobia bacterium CG_4_10_14_3_um_filter_43_23]PIY61515.1 MAG: pantoate--beta-alanine ligase [Verrucomicrobia bacterium CG_4_10_14_0_8_um_filter_43_34]PJA44418.1 MAG: pantoate--beta-alanine ligase [Verrucomicrobia bacterium CG_4_9_14_3_um_filter_43_20]